MPFFTPLRSVKNGTGLSAPLEQGPRRPRPSLAEPVTPLAAPPSDNGAIIRRYMLRVSSGRGRSLSDVVVRNRGLALVATPLFF